MSREQRPEFGLKAQLDVVQKQMDKERQEHRRKVDAMENQLDRARADNQVICSQQRTRKHFCTESKYYNILKGLCRP